MKKNPLRKFVDSIAGHPDWLRRMYLTRMFRMKVKFAGTAGLDILDTDGQSVTFAITNRRKVQNHIGGVHAAAMSLLAESATGFIVGINLPGDKLPLMKRMNINYVKRAEGDLTAKAWLTDEQVQQMENQDKGEITVAVTVTDEAGNQPVECEMLWAWIPKKK
ncbi:hypothetical protein HMF8227_02785 [Saliniradius amylolyticus]|uniref:DUF4442 domain-containing protein n=2 Tax=Saliniradius amylolyticus TaxID=2183582 RepID=A0A2S2E6F3_9ALTE|nr:hypothetical protein HMF8227_02785 [Saliniradius amylolyticus]